MAATLNSMNRAALLLPILALTLTGCLRAPAPVPEPAAAPEAEQSITCLTVHPDAITSLESHLNFDNYQVTTSAAIATADGWFIAATLEGDGEATGTWYTRNDPTLPGENAFSSADDVAEFMTDYLRPTVWTETPQGGHDAKACLT